MHTSSQQKEAQGPNALLGNLLVKRIPETYKLNTKRSLNILSEK